MLFQGKGGRASRGIKRMIKKSDLESLPFKGVPTDPILTASIQPDRVQEIEVRGDHLYLPIMHGSDECDIPLISVVQKSMSLGNLAY